VVLDRPSKKGIAVHTGSIFVMNHGSGCTSRNLKLYLGFVTSYNNSEALWWQHIVPLGGYLRFSMKYVPTQPEIVVLKVGITSNNVTWPLITGKHRVIVTCGFFGV